MSRIPDASIARLVAIARHAHEQDCSDWTPTPLRKELWDFAEKLSATAELLAQSGAAQTEVERLHEEQRTRTGVDGWPEPAPDHHSYGQIRRDLLELAETALQVADELPDPRQKTALPTAALGFLHLRMAYDEERPTLYEYGPDVAALDDICRRAGLHYSRARLKDALRTALQTFDPFYLPPELRGLLG